MLKARQRGTKARQCTVVYCTYVYYSHSSTIFYEMLNSLFVKVGCLTDLGSLQVDNCMSELFQLLMAFGAGGKLCTTQCTLLLLDHFIKQSVSLMIMNFKTCL